MQRAAELGYRALAITDRNSLAGVVRAHAAAKEIGLKLLIGAEITPVDAPAAVLLATDRAAYGRLCRLITRGRMNAPKGECSLTFADMAEFAEGLIACVCLPSNTSPRRTPTAPEGFRWAWDYRELFGDRCYLLAELHCGPNDRVILEQVRNIARSAGIPLIAANGVRYHDSARQQLQDVLTAVRYGCTVSELGERLFANSERHLKSPNEMCRPVCRLPGSRRADGRDCRSLHVLSR